MISHKTLNDPCSNDSLYEYSNQIHLERKRTSIEYLQQHRRWNSVRQKMKDLQMNRIDVTSYRNKLSSQSSKMQQLVPFMENCSFDLKNLKKKSHQLSNMDISIRKRKFSCRMIYSSSSNHQNKSSNKKSTNQLKSIKLRTPNKQDIATLQNPQTISLQQQPKPILGIAEDIEKIKLSPRQKQKKHCYTSASNHNTTLNANHFKFQNSHRKNINDMINFGLIEQSDENNRVIVRRKSKVDKTCFYLFESSLVKQKIILLYVDVIDGERMGSKASDSFSHTKSYKLFLGPLLVSDYLSLLSLPQSVSELASSTAKLAIILLDYLKIEGESLKINHEGIVNKFNKSSPSEIKDEIEQICKELESSTCFIQTRKHFQRKSMERSFKDGDKWGRRNKFVFDNASQNYSGRKPEINTVETPIKTITDGIKLDRSMLVPQVQNQNQIPKQAQFQQQNSKPGSSVPISEDMKVVNHSSFGPTVSVSQHIQPRSSNISEAIKTIQVNQLQKLETGCPLL